MVGILEYLAATGSVRRVLAPHADRAASTRPQRAVQADPITRLPHAESQIWYEEPAAGARTGLLSIAGVALPAGADIYVCGRTDFLQSVRARSRAAGIAGELVHVELFAPNDWLLDG